MAYSDGTDIAAARLRMAGYTRVILAGISLTYMSYHPKYCTLLYGISSLLDAVDGQVARALGQSSRFGAVLDMVTDRCGALSR
jgi:CDP-diacylglycerol--inositol 3-phosphatidyltransferase